MTETQWHEELRAKGYRVTPQRQLVLEAVKDLEHATPEEICVKVRETARGVNISTVYRTLELLEELGMVTHTHLGHGAPTYHLAAEADHVHLVCRGAARCPRCGRRWPRVWSTGWTRRWGSPPTCTT